MVQSAHLMPMILVGAYVFADRIAPAVPPLWGLPPAWDTLFGPLLRLGAHPKAILELDAKDAIIALYAVAAKDIAAPLGERISSASEELKSIGR